ncbi:MAG: IS982 family transposase [bacterium]|nr:IS982 family transposase [bacterium]
MSKLGVFTHTLILEDRSMNPRLDTLVTALYVRIDDLLAENPGWAPQRPAVGFRPRLSDAELVTLAVVSALLGFDSESRFVRYAKAHLRPWFPYLPNRDGCNKRLRRAGDMIARVVERLARECPDWGDDVWLVDSTPVECGRSRQTQRRSDLAGWAQYGWRASHSRFFWGLRLHLIATPSGPPIAFALAGAKADEREVCAEMTDRAGPARAGQTLIADKGYRSTAFEARLAQAGITVIRPATKKEPARPGAKPKTHH